MREKREFSFFMYCLIFMSFMILFCMTGCKGKDSAIFLSAEEASQEVFQQKETGKDIPDLSSKENGLTEWKVKEVIEETMIFVDVCGAVKNPGVYSLKAGSRVYEAVEAAGGFLQNAASGAVNQAKSLEDGQQIYIPTKEETESNLAFSSSSSQAETEKSKVNINTADAEVLMTLKGIGEAKAEAILAYREENGGFSSIEELMNVQGIKESTFVKIKDDIMVG